MKYNFKISKTISSLISSLNNFPIIFDKIQLNYKSWLNIQGRSAAGSDDNWKTLNNSVDTIIPSG